MTCHIGRDVGRFPPFLLPKLSSNSDLVPLDSAFRLHPREVFGSSSSLHASCSQIQFSSLMVTRSHRLNLHLDKQEKNRFDLRLGGSLYPSSPSCLGENIT